MRYRYRVLGTTQALREDGTAVSLGGARLRALLTALALAGGRTVRTDVLVGEVWAGGSADAEPPADAVAALQALVGRLRRALGREVLASDPTGYRLLADRDDIDLFRFERLAGEGAAALAGGDADKAAGLLDEALALWRGPALADLPAGGGAPGVRAGSRHLAARRTRLEAALALGEAEAALPTVRELAAGHPLDEPLHALHLRALRDTGRQAEALAVYEEVRADLADRLGADPGPELRALHAELLAPQPTPQPTPQPAPAGPDRARTPRGNLRARLTSFVGREPEIRALRADLAGSRLVTLTGPGGAGKTRLSQEAAAATDDELWPDGVWMAELAPVRDPAHLAEAVLTALGGRETVIRGSTAEGLRAATDPHALDPLAQLTERCATRRMLLVLDNCEHVIDAAATLAEALLLECPHVTVLATSREPLGVPGESVRPLEPLPDPVALRLLADRGASARPGFRTADDPDACAEICRRLDGLPLAVELAAARLRALTPRQLADRLDDRFRLLTSGSRTALPRQQTLRAVVDWSWDLLEDAERSVLRRLSVFSGGCELGQAEEVCGETDADPGAGSAAAGGVSRRDVAVLLGSLVDKSLVVAAPGAGGMRYGLLETVAEYAGERLDEVAGDRAAAERRHLVAYRELARTTDPLLRGPYQIRHLDRLEREHDNIRTALSRALAARDEQEALCLVLSMNWFWQLRDHRAESYSWTVATAALGPDPFEGHVGGPVPPLPERCTDTPPPMAPEVLWEARRGVRLIELMEFEGDPTLLEDPERQDLFRAITAVYTPGAPQTCRMPGCMWFFAWMLTRPFSELEAVMEATVAGCRAYGYDWELAFILQLRAKFNNDRADGMLRSAQDADESLAIYTRLGDCWGMAEALAGRAEGRCTRGEFAAAAEDYRRAVSCAEQLGAHTMVPFLRSRLGAALWESGDSEQVAEGAELLREAYEQSEQQCGQVNFATLQYALYLGRTGATERAREVLEPLEAEFRDRMPVMFIGMVRGMLAWLHCLEGEYERGLALAAEALELSSDRLAGVVTPTLAVYQCVTVARALAALGDPETAARLLGAYDVHTRLPAGHMANPAEREWREIVGAGVRAALAARPGGDCDGPDTYARAHAEGGGLSLEEATALVRRALPGDPPASPEPPA